MTKRTVTFQQFLAEAVERFGDDKMLWKFECPGCGHIASVQDYKDASAPSGAVGFSCIGRYLGGGKCRDWLGGEEGEAGPCNYTQGGLFGISPVRVIVEGEPEHYSFELAPGPESEPRITTGNCPTCQTPKFTTEHNILGEKGEPVHHSNCPDCGDNYFTVGYDCPDCDCCKKRSQNTNTC